MPREDFCPRKGVAAPGGAAESGSRARIKPEEFFACGPEGTLDEVEEFLRAKVPQPLEKPGGKRPKSR